MHTFSHKLICATLVRDFSLCVSRRNIVAIVLSRKVNISCQACNKREFSLVSFTSSSFVSHSIETLSETVSYCLNYRTEVLKEKKGQKKRLEHIMLHSTSVIVVYFPLYSKKVYLDSCYHYLTEISYSKTGFQFT